MSEFCNFLSNFVHYNDTYLSDKLSEITMYEYLPVILGNLPSSITYE